MAKLAAIARTADATLDLFFDVVDSGQKSANYENLKYLMTNVFSSSPSVGITSYGPQFIGAPAVTTLFRQLFVTFDALSLAEVDTNLRLYSKAGQPVTIGTQTTFTGIQQTFWFQAAPYYSPPISNISPDGIHSTQLDASAVFTFAKNDPLNKIDQISIYFDRWLMAQQLTPKPGP